MNRLEWRLEHRWHRSYRQSKIKKINENKSWFFEQQVYTFNSKTRTLKAGGGSGNVPKVIISNKDETIYYRYFTPLECERLQTVPDNYTNFVAKVHRYKMLGNGWTIDVIAYILENLKDFNE